MMRVWRWIVLGAFALGPTAAAQGAEVPERLTTRDGVRVAGAFYRASTPRATILLFHQAGSGKGEYATIAPRLATMGYDALAIDQRVGGSLFGSNATAAGVRGKPRYIDAANDVEAAFAWAARRGRPVILWGSSYSAALVFRLAAAHPRRIAGLLAFSPGEYLENSPSVAMSAGRVTAPVFVTNASDRTETVAARRIFASVRSRIRTHYVPRVGIHGSSTLIAVRNPRGAAANWAAVRAFLMRIVA